MSEPKINNSDRDIKIKLKSTFLESITHKRLTVFEVKCGDIVNHVELFNKEGIYGPYLVPHEVTVIYWNKGVTDFTDYYKID